MKDTDLLVLFKRLTKKEVKRFYLELKKSFKDGSIVFCLLSFLKKYHADDKLDKVTYEKAYAYLSLDRPFDKRTISNALSDIKLELDKYLIDQYLIDSPYEKDRILLEVYKDYQVDNLIKKKFGKMSRMLEKTEQKDHNFWLRRMQLDQEHYSFASTQRLSIKARESIYGAMQNLDYFYAALKWKFSSKIYNGFRIGNEEEPNILLLSAIENLNWHQDSYYHHFYRLATRMIKKREQAVYHQLKDDFFNNHMKVAIEDQFIILTYLLNHNADVVRRGKEDVGKETFEILKFGLEQQLFIFQGFLYPNHFLNAIGVAADIGEVKWASDCIEKWSAELEPSTCAYYKNLGKAILYFRTQQFERCLSLLNNMRQDGPQDKLRERWLYIATNYELVEQNIGDGYNHLSHQINSFKSFIQRNPLLNQTIKQAFLSSLKIVTKLLKPDPNKQQILNLLEESGGFHYKNWLLQKAKSL